MSPQNESLRYVLDEEISVYPAGEERIAVHVAKDEIHRLNPTAAQVLDVCDGRSFAEIAIHLKNNYPDVPADRIEEDVESVLALLVAKGVLRILPSGNDD